MKHTPGMGNTPLTDFNSWVEDIEEKGQVELCKADFARTLERDRAELLEVAKLLLDFYNLETQLFVEKYGHGITTRILGDRARAAIAKATNQKP